MIKIAVLGYGTVGSGVVKVLNTNAKKIAKRAGQEIEVKYVLDLRDFPDDPIQNKVVHDYEVIEKDDEVSVVVDGIVENDGLDIVLEGFERGFGDNAIGGN